MPHYTSGAKSAQITNDATSPESNANACRASAVTDASVVIIVKLQRHYF